VLVPSADEVAFAAALRDNSGAAMFSAIDSSAATAREPVASMIRNVLHKCGGYGVVDDVVKGALLAWLGARAHDSIAALDQAATRRTRSEHEIVLLRLNKVADAVGAMADDAARYGLVAQLKALDGFLAVARE
jgi:hypothetical protein